MDVKRKLRELIPVQSTECALHEIDKILTTSSSIQQKNFILELVSEFVFYEKHGTNRIISKLEELLILQKICQYFNTSKTVNQSALFAIMFNKELLIKRKVFFHKLISMSILMPVPNILNATGILMNQLGNVSKKSLEICDMLIDEYFINYSVCYTYLDKLPKFSPIFTSNFITGLCKLYGIRCEGFRIKLPSIKMLEILSNWLKEYPHLCMLNADSIKNYKNVQNEPAFFGLMKWCVFMPIYELIAKKSSPIVPKSVELDFDYEFYSDKSTILNQRHLSHWNNFYNNDFQGNMSSSYEQFFSQIHLCLLNSLQVNSSNEQYRLRSHVDQLTSIVNEILVIIAKEDLSENNSSLYTSITRLSQFIQFFSFLKILDGNKIELTIQLNNLPQNRHLSTIIKNL